MSSISLTCNSHDAHLVTSNCRALWGTQRYATGIVNILSQVLGISFGNLAQAKSSTVHILIPWEFFVLFLCIWSHSCSLFFISLLFYSAYLQTSMMYSHNLEMSSFAMRAIDMNVVLWPLRLSSLAYIIARPVIELDSSCTRLYICGNSLQFFLLQVFWDLNLSFTSLRIYAPSSDYVHLVISTCQALRRCPMIWPWYCGFFALALMSLGPLYYHRVWQFVYYWKVWLSIAWIVSACTWLGRFLLGRRACGRRMTMIPVEWACLFLDHEHYLTFYTSSHLLRPSPRSS